MANEKRLMYADDFLDLFYVASAGQDKAFIKTVEMVVEDTPTVEMAEMKWIPVSERLPEKSDYYLAFTDTGVIGVLPFSAQYKLFNAFDGDGTKHNIPVTHWMPLPQPPKGE